MKNLEITPKPNTLETIKPSLESANEKKHESSQHERDLAVKNPELVGMNFDQDYIVDGRNFWSQERYFQYIQERDGQISQEVHSAEESGKLQEYILSNRGKETRKGDIFKKYLSSFEGKLQHVRVHPAGECSPLTPSQSIEIKSDGTFEVVIAPEFIDQTKMIQEQVTDLTLVVQFYDHRRDKEKSSDVPETLKQEKQYIALCEKIIEKVGNDVQLEIGNETNVSKSTGPQFANELQHASHVDSIEYGKFFFEVAKRIKEKNSKVRLSVAGVACFDPTYLREVLTEIRRLQTESKIDAPLVDTISFHPYREKPENGSVEIRNGNFVASELDYEKQMEEMQKIASEFGVKLTVGETNFSSYDPKQKEKLEQAISLTTDKKIEFLIYPGVNVHMEDIEKKNMNPNTAGELYSISRDILTVPNKAYRFVKGKEAIDDLNNVGFVRNKQSAGLAQKPSNWGERVFWSKGAEGKYHGVSQGTYVIEAPLSIVEERVVTKKDITAIYTKNENGEVINILEQQRLQEEQKMNDIKNRDEEKLKEVRRSLGLDKK